MKKSNVWHMEKENEVEVQDNSMLKKNLIKKNI
jgi:hypothetical protein